MFFQLGEKRHGDSAEFDRIGDGFRDGTTFGSTGDFGNSIVQDTLSIHDTILHQLGFDHESLTFRHGGLDQRLTDVHGRIVDLLLD